MINTDKGLLFFDTETTGILKNDKNEVISNGSMIQLAYRQLKDGQKFDQNLFFMTDTRIEIGSMAVHGIYPKLLEQKSDGKYLDDETRTQISEIMNDNIIIAHNIDFDRDVLGKEGISYTNNQIDTLKVAKVLWSEGVLKNSLGEEPEYVNLQYLRYYFELYEINDANGQKECTTAHDAFGDVVVLENVFYKLFEIIKNKLDLTDDEVIEKMIEMTQKEFILIKTMRVGKYRGSTFEEVANIDKGYLEWMLKADFTEDIKYTCKVWLGLIEDKKFFK